MYKKQLSARGKIFILAVFLVISEVISLTLGRYPIGIADVFEITAGQLFGTSVKRDSIRQSLFLNHRLPRVIMACFIGCCLSAAGAAYQGVFQNPMAAPDILGASSGAAFGAALAILLGSGSSITVVSAFVFSVLTVAMVIFTGSCAKGNRVTGFILSGIMIGSLISSGTSFIKLVADPADRLPAITYWLMGSLNGISLQEVKFSLIPMIIGLIPLFLLRWRINILTLGDEEARTIGVNPKNLRLTIILCATLITAASVSVSGVIGWIGLVVPHMARRMVGNNYKYLMPASMLLGSIFLLWVDNISRNLYATEIPIGILTSFIGAPFFIYLITKESDII